MSMILLPVPFSVQVLLVLEGPAGGGTGGKQRTSGMTAVDHHGRGPWVLDIDK